MAHKCGNSAFAFFYQLDQLKNHEVHHAQDGSPSDLVSGGLSISPPSVGPRRPKILHEQVRHGGHGFDRCRGIRREMLPIGCATFFPQRVPCTGCLFTRARSTGMKDRFILPLFLWNSRVRSRRLQIRVGSVSSRSDETELHAYLLRRPTSTKRRHLT